MSMGLMVYLVPEKETIAVIGCQDDELLADVLEQMATDIQSLDEEFDTDDEKYGPGITFSQAMRELFQGSLSQPKSCDFVYTYAFEEVCRYYGDWLGNSQFARCSTEWLKHHDGLLSQHGIPLRFHDLVYRCPVKSLLYREVLHLGHWKRSEAMRARCSFEKLPSIIKDEVERLCLEEAGKWLTAACDKPGSMVMGVFC